MEDIIIVRLTDVSEIAVSNIGTFNCGLMLKSSWLWFFVDTLYLLWMQVMGMLDSGLVDTVLQKSSHNEVLNRLADMGDEADRRKMLERLFAYMEERGTPIVAVPTISKIAVDLFRLYHIVKDFGGMVEVCLGHLYVVSEKSYTSLKLHDGTYFVLFEVQNGFMM